MRKNHDQALLAQSGCLGADTYGALTLFQSTVIMASCVVTFQLQGPSEVGTTLTPRLQIGQLKH